MSLLKIQVLGSSILRVETTPVAEITDELQLLIDDMCETMHAAQGIGLAAPQVGRSERLAVIEIEGEQYVIINPEIYWTSRETVKGLEGCLSIPGYVGEVERAESIRVRGLDRHGRKFRRRFYDWDARIFQHEIDHLNGVLFLDHVEGPEALRRLVKVVDENGKERWKAIPMVAAG